jgi:hypothetical protein
MRSDTDPIDGTVDSICYSPRAYPANANHCTEGVFPDAPHAVIYSENTAFVRVWYVGSLVDERATALHDFSARFAHQTLHYQF